MSKKAILILGVVVPALIPSFVGARYGSRGPADDAHALEGAPADWYLIDGTHWQKQAIGPFEAPEQTDARETVNGAQTHGSCKIAGMVHVEGHMKPSASEYLQNAACVSKGDPERCAKFDREKWLKLSASLPTKPLDFCIDRYEYPNVSGQNPVVEITYYEAENLCHEQGKRLCSDEEWTFACEGEEAMPYPYGYERDAEKCNFDRDKISPDYSASKLMRRSSAEGGAEVARLWEGEPSGSRPGCKSPFGVHDMTGNVDEWTSKKLAGAPSQMYHGSLKGGYWAKIRARCRPATTAHYDGYAFYQQGVRCCSDE